MKPNLTHISLEELLGVYALDAVDDDERRIVDQHISVCPRCRSEVEGHREVAAMLAGDAHGAPDSARSKRRVWDQIVTELTAEAPPLKLASVVPISPKPEGPQIRERSQTTRASQTAVWMAGVAAALVLLLGAGLAVQSTRLSGAEAELAAREQQVASLAATLQAEPLDQAVNAALSDPAAQVVSLTADTSLDAMLVVLLPDGTGYVVQNSLDPLPADATYQLWAVVDGKVISAGVLGNEPEVVPFHLDPEGLEGLVITQEEAGGVPQSEADPVVAWFEA
jgi:hypothetical protein